MWLRNEYKVVLIILITFSIGFSMLYCKRYAHTYYRNEEPSVPIYKAHLTGLDLSHDIVWKRILAILDIIDWKIQTLDRVSGIIVLENQLVDISFCNCARWRKITTSGGRKKVLWEPELGIRWGYLNIYYERIAVDEAIITITSDFNIREQEFNIFTGQSYYGSPRKCGSTGKIENFILEEIKKALPKTKLEVTKKSKKA